VGKKPVFEVTIGINVKRHYFHHFHGVLIWIRIANEDLDPGEANQCEFGFGTQFPAVFIMNRHSIEEA
jgi:hypothetical protein